MIQITAIKYCKWCGKPFEVKSPNQKYCSTTISNCSKEAKRESWRKASKKYRKNYKDILYISQVYKLGSGLLSSNPHINFDDEYLAIQKEKKRLKLGCIWFGLSFVIQFSENFIGIIIKRNIIPTFELYPQLLVFFVFIIGVLIFGIYQDIS
jgi:hypothetical protein